VNACNRHIPSRESIVIRKIRTLMHELRRCRRARKSYAQFRKRLRRQSRKLAKISAKSERRARYARQLKGIDHRTSLLHVRKADGSLTDSTEEMRQELGASFSKQRGCSPQLPVVDRKANRYHTRKAKHRTRRTLMN
jgi:hypothetical protein